MQLPIAVSGRSALDVARECAGAAGDVIRAGFGRTGVSGTKGRGNVVTEADFEAERRTMEILSREFPGHAILSEETSAAARSSSWMWVVDPLDGTKNFSRAIPHFAFSIALCFAEQPVLALTSHPLLGEEFTAVKGSGAAFNGAPIAVSTVAAVHDSVISLDLGYDDARGARQLALAERIFPGVQCVRTMGSAALGFAFVAAGRFDAYLHSDLQPWDIAAGLLLVLESGGAVSDRDGSEATIWSRAVIAGNPAVQSELARLAAPLPVD